MSMWSKASTMYLQKTAIYLELKNGALETHPTESMFSLRATM